MVVAIYLLAVVVVLLSVIYLSFKNSYRFWEKRHVPFLSPQFPLGNLNELSKVNIAIALQNIYNQLKGKGDYGGVYFFKQPTLFVTSPEFAKTVLLRDFNVFIDRGFYYNPKDDPLTSNLFFHGGSKWTLLRNKLNPAFTPEKIEIQLHTFTDVVDDLVQYIEKISDQDVDARELLTKFTSDVFSFCIFDVEESSLKDGETDFINVGRRILAAYKAKPVFVFLAMIFKSQARQLGFKLFDRESLEYYTNIVHKQVGFRRENNIHRHDIIQAMIEIMRQDYESDEGLTIDEIVYNTFAFFFIGFETCSITLLWSIYSLALNKNIQEQARKEIETVLQKHDGKLSWKALLEMDLIDRILSETLRLYPPFPSLHRVSAKNYVLPNGSEIPKGTPVIIPVYAIHHDEKYYPDPEKFDPERFTDQNKSKRHSYSYLPYGEGPRMCIGQRLAQMQVKVGLASIIRNFQIDVTPKTENHPPAIDTNSLTFAPNDEIWLKFHKI